MRATRELLYATLCVLCLGCTSGSQRAEPRDAGMDAAADAEGRDAEGDPPPRGRDADAEDASDLPDAGAQDADSADAGDAEPGEADGGTTEDAGAPAVEVDAGRDASLPDAGVGDTDADAAEPACEDTLPPIEVAPARLSETGLYADIRDKRVADALLPFAPQFELWSDGAVKTRWMYLPECEGLVDTSDMDDWALPVGARAFKEFAANGKRIETRMIHRYGPGAGDFLFAHYLWDDDENDAVLITEDTPLEALVHPKGTTHVVPKPSLCIECHRSTSGGEGTAARYLGFSAIQLSHDGPGATMHSLSAARRLTRPRREGFEVPGDAVERAALGYLHANCGHCHNDSHGGVAFPEEPFVLWLRAADASLRDTGAYQTALHVEVRGYDGDCTHRILPGDPGLAEPPDGPVKSCVLERTAIRREGRQMPPLATDQVHQAGLETLRAWIRTL